MMGNDGSASRHKSMSKNTMLLVNKVMKEKSIGKKLMIMKIRSSKKTDVDQT